MPEATPPPPVAERRPHTLEAHGDRRVDDWYWLRDKDDPAVIGLLEAENAHTEAVLAHLEELRTELYDEMVARIQETDLSVPARKGAWWYYSRTVEGQQYSIVCRRPGTPEGPDGDEQVLLDENELAAGHDFFTLGLFAVSPDGTRLAYGTDTTGAETYTVRIRDLTTGDDLADVIEGAYYGEAWSRDGATLFYTRPDAAMRPHQLWRHTVGTPVSQDALVYQEDDERFFLGVSATRSERWILLQLASKVTSEVHLIDADDPTGPARVVRPRQQGLEYDVEHHGDTLFITTNADGAEDFKVVSAPVTEPGRWSDVLPHRPGTKVDGVDAFARHLVVHERAEGLAQLRVIDLDHGGDGVLLQMDEPVYALSGESNPEFDTTVFRFAYSSLVTPPSVYDHDLVSGERVLRKQQPVLGGYDPSDYVTRRLRATATDGARIPISVVHRRDVALDGTAPCLLYGYGSYEASIDPRFSSLRLSLLDRGVVYAIGHVRGGGELGRRWYEEGKLLRKANTFTDFVACAEHLVALGCASPERLAIRGGSAGGLLMGATLNLRPDLFRAVVAEVPFVDCLTTILDETLPLTVLEWEEWGNPVTDPEVYAYMRSYSPYDNVDSVAHPAMFVTAGLNDPRVSYWEPAKWVQRLRATTTGERPIVLKTEMGAGHMGPSGRYDAWKDEALVFAFVLDQLGAAG